MVYSNGNYVAIVTAVCPVCGTVHETNDLVLHKQLKKVFPPSGRTKPMTYDLCDMHKKMFADGYIALVGVSADKSVVKDGVLNMEDAYRTGRLAHIRASAWESVFNVPVPSDKEGKVLPMVFIDDSVLDSLEELHG